MTARRVLTVACILLALPLLGVTLPGPLAHLLDWSRLTRLGFATTGAIVVAVLSLARGRIGRLRG